MNFTLKFLYFYSIRLKNIFDLRHILAFSIRHRMLLFLEEDF